MPKQKPSEARRIQFTKKERDEGLALDTARLEANDRYGQWFVERLRAHGIDPETPDTAWDYESRTGVAQRRTVRTQ